MRVTESYKYFNFLSNQQNVMGGLNKTLNQLSTGLKIQNGSEDPTAFINSLKLDQEVTTLKQSTANMNSSQKFANHTDTTLNSITQSLEQFKTKLVYAANDEHDQTSYGALAKELKGIRDHMVNLSNTNINGEYLFSGSATSVKPVSDDGTYNGNDLSMKALIGSNVEKAYNIPGADLFLGQDGDYAKKVTTNVVLYNQSKLHPDVMEDGYDDESTSIEQYINQNDTIRDLVGDNDKDKTNDGDYYFYVSGVKSGGEAFKEKLTIQTDSSVESLLTRIGEAYGNTSNNKVVDVQINKGRLEITDLQKGSSKLDFHMFGSDTNNNDLDALVAAGSDIKEFIKSPNKNVPTIGEIPATSSKYDNSEFTINSSLKTSEGLAKHTTDLDDIFAANVDNVRLHGFDSDNNPVDISLAKAGNKVSDLLSAVEANFGDVDARITDEGKIEIIDNSGNGNFNLNLQTRDATNTQVNGLGNDVAAMQTIAFDKNDAYVKGNVAQVVTATNEFATDKTKLSEVASNGTVSGTIMDLTYTDIGGNERSAQLDLTGANAVVNIDDDKDGVTDRSFTVLNAQYDDANSNGVYDGGEEVPTPVDEMTYKQLQDVMGMLVTDNIPADLDRTDYKDKSNTAEGRVDAYVDQSGMLTIKDKIQAQTPIEFSMNDSNANDFGANASAMTFSANNSLIVDDVHVDMFAMLDSAIEAVENGFTRPDAGNENMMRSVGIQNLIDKLDHVTDHTIRKHTQVGAVSQSFNYQISRNETLVVHTETLQSQIIDVDYAEAAMNLQQLQLNYQAMSSSFAKIQNLSLLNYL